VILERGRNRKDKVILYKKAPLSKIARFWRFWRGAGGEAVFDDIAKAPGKWITSVTFINQYGIIEKMFFYT